MANADYCKAGYGVLTEQEQEAIDLFAKHEGLLLDPVYTGRAAAGMINLIRNGFFKKDETVLFLHTGGQPALFANEYRTAQVRDKCAAVISALTLSAAAAQQRWPCP